MADELMWHRPAIECGKCGKNLTIIDVAINSNSQILIECLCLPCGLEGQATITFNRACIKTLIEMDMLQNFKEVVDE